ncbi:MAG: cupin domain-containing protein [Alphaproteobacteria bacterium]|jgi:uncharacterized cupin superfamily protein|nr:cupin domain-containing protein [Alphaproteobacteria bacterium]
MATKASEFPIVDPNDLQGRTGSAYPAAFQGVVEGREVRALGDALGLSNFGVNLVTLQPGAASSQRHWHSREDEFVYVLDGDLILVTEAGETALGPGMAAGFPAGKPDGHCLVNRSDRPVRFLVVGDRSAADECHYPDIDLHMKRGLSARFTRKDGSDH